MAKIAAIVTDNVEDVELSSPKEALEAARHEVVLIEKEAGKTIKGKKEQNSRSTNRLMMFLLKTLMLY